MSTRSRGAGAVLRPRAHMQQILPALGVSAVVFISTNIDDILLLTAFFSDPDFTPRQVVAGQFLGMAALVLASVACALLAVRVPEGWIGLLGLAPLALGLRGLWALWQGRGAGEDEADEADEADQRRGRAARLRSLAVATVTVANGGDNLGVYIPLFSSSPGLIPLHAAVFAVMTGALCALGHHLVNHPVLGSRIRRHGRVALPFVLIGLGLWILSDALVLIRPATAAGPPPASLGEADSVPAARRLVDIGDRGQRLSPCLWTGTVALQP
ncbi:cadmium resistance transporter [Sorangium sp. So ce1151]|uniref:cadmium resistance transporter n=1 Tax=Sorangium sp. So ce1151 TaxID=3133332 RepID=UPI003F5F7917